MSRRTLTAAAIAIAALAVASTGTVLASSAAAHAGGVNTGTWRGTIQNQELSFAEGSYTTKIVVKANRGRISWVAATVRMECPETTVWDAQVSKTYPKRTGPKLTANGGFTVRIPTVDGPFSKAGAKVRVSGALKPGGASGRATARAEAEGCSGTGNWQARRIH
jgi:hypothetical protein